MSNRYDKNGKRLKNKTKEDWKIIESLLTNMKYRRIWLEEKELYTISTVRLGLDHRYDKKWGPLIFETCIFMGWFDGGWESSVIERYETKEEALAWHRKICMLSDKDIINMVK